MGPSGATATASPLDSLRWIGSDVDDLRPMGVVDGSWAEPRRCAARRDFSLRRPRIPVLPWASVLELAERARGRGTDRRGRRSGRAGPRILELGNVLGNYAPTSHDVVDRYEQGNGVRNIDVFDVDGSYDLVLSISTIEHIGWDERPVDPDRAASAVRHLQSLVAEGGSTLITVPVGYHPELDRAIVAGAVEFDEVRALSCSYPAAEWREVEPRAIVDTARYDRLLYRANAVLVCRWSRDRAL